LNSNARERARTWVHYLYFARQFCEASGVLSKAEDAGRLVYAHLAINRHCLELILKALLVRDRGFSDHAIAEAALKKLGHGFRALAEALRQNEFLRKNAYFDALLELAEHFGDTSQGSGFRYPYARTDITTFRPGDIQNGLNTAIMALLREAEHELLEAEFASDEIVMLLDGQAIPSKRLME